ncbi:putative Ig domain-containing protein [Fibrella aquatica]|uniref:putative Ig domain-containing protein n=1 Tax=Fibrella aquatica TaxID=3242487 RepID=UPI00351FE7A9
MRNNYFFNLLCSALLSLFGLLLTHSSFGQVTGTVFKDFNINGVKDNTTTFNEVGMSGVRVIATKSDGSLLTVTYTGSGTATNGTGGYAITGGTLGQMRLEFLMPDDYTFASNGSSGGTTVMFPSAATQNLAVNYPADYCGIADPLLVTSCYVGNNAAGVNDVLVEYAYSSAGVAHSPSHSTIAVANQIGSVYGIGYDRTNKTIYAGAFLKRHIPLKDNNSDGKEDLGAIYKIPASGTPSLWLDVTTLGVDVGMALMPTIATRALPLPATTSDLAASHDTEVFSLVGKVGLGDVDVSDDNSKLFFVNLNDSKIYTVDLATKTLVGSGIAVPSACTGGNARPFALTYHRGKLYVGAVCDAATSKVDTDMKATVYRLDGATLTSILSYPLNYTKGAAFKEGGNLYGNKWNPWEDTFSNVFGFTSSSGLKALAEPQPMFADLLFDTDESLIMVLNDRLGHQTGTANFQPSTSDKNLYYGIAAGDLLRASLVAGVYTLEKNGSSGGITTAGAGNGQGPGTPTATGYTSPSGEFYVGDDENGVHEEVVAGGAALVPGRGQVAVQVSDPAANYFAGGTYRFNNTTGEFDQSYVVFIDPSFGQQPWLFGKANGLGDLEVLCNNAPIEIGNRVWNDQDSDGIQDAGETGIAGVSVSLCTGTGTLIATATTDASGNYYFSSASGTNTASALYGLAALTAKTAYTLKFPTTNSGKSLVTPNASADNIDSDAPTTGVISFSTADFGANDHTFDVGYGTAPCSLTATATAGLCASATNQYTASGTISLANNTAGGIATITDGAVSTTVSVAASATSVPYTLPGLLSGTGSHTVIVSLPGCGTAAATYSAPASCTVAPVQLAVVVTTPVCNSATNQYTATGTVSLTNATAGTLTITNNGTSLTTIAITAGQTSATFTVSGVSNGPATRTIVAAISSLSATTTYIVPASCTVCTTTLTTTSLPGGQVGTNYNQTLTTTGGTTPYAYTVSAGTLPAGLTLNPTTGAITGTPTAAATTTFTIKVTDAKSCTDVQSFTIVTSALPVCSLDLLVTPGTCNSATNQYSLSGTVGLTNPVAGNLVVTDGMRSTTLTITASTTSVTYSLTGLTSGSGSHTVVANLAGCGSDNVTYTAPAACTVAPPAIAVAVGTPVCNSATNNYNTTGTVSLTNATAGTLTITDNGATISTVSVTAGQTTAGFSVSGISNVASHTVIATLNGLSASTTYLAPTSCTVAAVCAQNIVVTPGSCNSATNQYSISGTVSFTNAVAGTLTITDGASSTTVAVTTGATSVAYTLTGFTSNGASHTITSSLTGCGTDFIAYVAPASCTVCTTTLTTSTLPNGQVGTAYSRTLVTSGGTTPYAYTVSAGTLPAGLTLNPTTGAITGTPTAAATTTFTIKVTDAKSCTDVQSFTIVTSALPVCSLDLLVTPGTCNSATNQYSLSGTVGLTNPVAGNLVVTDGTKSTTVAVTASTTAVVYFLTGLTSGSGSHTVVANLAGCGTDNAIYTAPAACTLCTIGLTTTSLPNGQVGQPYSRTIIAIGGTLPVSFTVSAGTLPAGITLSPTTGVLSGTPTASGNFPVTIRVTDAKSCSAAVAFTTFQIDPVTQRAMAVTVNTPVCNPATDRYTATGTVSLTNSPAGSLTITDKGTIVSVISVTAGQTSANFSLSGLSNGPAVQLVNAVLGTLSASTTYTTPASCTACVYPAVVASANSTTIAEGQSATLTASVIPSGGVTYLWNAPAGISLVTNNAAIVTATNLPAGVHTFTVTVTNQAGCSTIATTCVSVPFTACQGSDYAFELSAPLGYANYQWRYTAPGSATSTVVQSSSATSYVATQAGEYSVEATKQGISTCSDGSCCPIIVRELPTPVAPSLTLVVATCNSQTAAVANNDAQIVLSGTALAGLSYNIVKGSSFTAAAPLYTTNRSLPTSVGSVLANGLTNPLSAQGDQYTVRIFSAGGCFTDVVVTLPATTCSCPPAKCVPLLVRVVKRGRP